MQSSGSALRYHFANTAKIILRQLYSQCPHVLLEVLAALCAGNSHYVFTLRQHPTPMPTATACISSPRDFFHAAHEVKIFLEILPLKTRRETPVIVSGQVFKSLDLAGEKPASQRAVGDKADAQFPTGGQDFIFGIAGPQLAASTRTTDRNPNR